MREIYQGVSQVIIYLGEGSEEISGSVMQSFVEVSQLPAAPTPGSKCDEDYLHQRAAVIGFRPQASRQ